MNKRNPIRKIAAAMLALCLCVTGVLYDVKTVKADIDPNTFYALGGSFYVSGLSHAAAGESYLYRCQLAWPMELSIRFVVPVQPTVKISIYAGESASGTLVFQGNLSAGSWLFDMNEGVYFSQAPTGKKLDAGTYTIKVTFDSAIPYYLALAEEYDGESAQEPSTTAHTGWYVDPSGTAGGGSSGGPTSGGDSTGGGGSAGSGTPTIKNSQLSETDITLTAGAQITLKVLNPPNAPII